MSSYVYFIHDNRLAVKIGWSADPESRLRELQTGNPAQLKLLGAIPGTRNDERDLHRLLEKYRLIGEWFILDDILKQGVAEAIFLQSVRNLKAISERRYIQDEYGKRKPADNLWKLELIRQEATKLIRRNPLITIRRLENILKRDYQLSNSQAERVTLGMKNMLEAAV